MTEIWNYLPRRQAKEIAVKCLFNGHNRMAQVGFELGLQQYF